MFDTQFERDLEELRSERRKLAAENHNLRIRLAQYQPKRGNCAGCGGLGRIDDFPCPDCNGTGGIELLDPESNAELWQLQDE